MYQCLIWLTPAQRRVQRALGELLVHRLAHRPANELARVHVQHQRNVQPALVGGHVGHVGQPFLVGRRGHKSRRPRSAGTDRRGLIAGVTSIDERPMEVNERLVPGHWEGDLIKGARNQSQVGTLVERKTLYTVLVQLDNATAEHTAQRFGFVLNRLDAAMRLSMTYDNGKEMAHHQSLSQSTGIRVFFAHPYSPWERGINENTNGLLRRVLPKGSDLSVYTQEQLDAIAFHHNAKPRKSLGWKSPAELFLPQGTFDFQAYWTNIINPVALGA